MAHRIGLQNSSQTQPEAMSSLQLRLLVVSGSCSEVWGGIWGYQNPWIPKPWMPHFEQTVYSLEKLGKFVIRENCFHAYKCFQNKNGGGKGPNTFQNRPFKSRLLLQYCLMCSNNDGIKKPTYTDSSSLQFLHESCHKKLVRSVGNDLNSLCVYQMYFHEPLNLLAESTVVLPLPYS